MKAGDTVWLQGERGVVAALMEEEEHLLVTFPGKNHSLVVRHSKPSGVIFITYDHSIFRREVCHLKGHHQRIEPEKDTPLYGPVCETPDCVASACTIKRLEVEVDEAKLLLRLMHAQHTLAQDEWMKGLLDKVKTFINPADDEGWEDMLCRAKEEL